MGRPIKRRKRAPKGISLKSPDVLERLRARTAATGLGYTDVVRQALDALDARAQKVHPDDVARRRAAIDAMQAAYRTRRAAALARGETWHEVDHNDLYDEYGLPK